MLFPDTGNLLACGQRLVAVTGRETGEPWEPEQMRAPSQQTIRLTKNTEILRRQLTTTSTSFTRSRERKLWELSFLNKKQSWTWHTGLTLMMMIIVSILLFLCPNVRYCGAMTIEILTMAISTKNYNLQRPVMIIHKWLCRYAVRQYFIFNHKHRFINLIYTLEQLVIYKYFNCLFYSII